MSRKFMNETVWLDEESNLKVIDVALHNVFVNDIKITISDMPILKYILEKAFEKTFFYIGKL